MNEAKIRKALNCLNENSDDESAQEVLVQQLGRYAVIVRSPNGTIDVDETMDGLAFSIATGGTTIEGCLTITAFLAKPKMVVEANPFDDRPLRKGKTVSEPIHDLSTISNVRRRWIAYARRVGKLPHPGDPNQVGFIIQALSKAKPAFPWPEIAKELDKIDEAASGGDKNARRWSEAIDDMLVFRAGRPREIVELAAIERPIPVAIPVPERPSRRELRLLMNRVLRSDSELNAFACDFFREVSDKFSNGMDRDTKIDLLFRMKDDDEILEKLKEGYPKRFTACT